MFTRVILSQFKVLVSYLTNAGQFGEQHLEDRWRQSLLQHLQQLLWLTTHCNGIGQVVHAFLIVSYTQTQDRKLFFQLYSQITIFLLCLAVTTKVVTKTCQYPVQFYSKFLNVCNHLAEQIHSFWLINLADSISEYALCLVLVLGCCWVGVTLSQKLLPQLYLLQEELLHCLGILKVWKLQNNQDSVTESSSNNIYTNIWMLRWSQTN